MVEYVDSFEKHFEKLKQNNTIDGIIRHTDTAGFDDSIPANVRALYNTIYAVEITKPRTFKLLPLTEKDLLAKRWVDCADIGGHIVCLDTSHLNAAGEFDVVNAENQYVVTKTLASLLTNKVWAWIERGRKVWTEEG